MKVVDSLAMRAALWAIPVLTVGMAVSVLYVLPLLLSIPSPRERYSIYHCDSADLDRLVSQTVWFPDPVPACSIARWGRLYCGASRWG